MGRRDLKSCFAFCTRSHSRSLALQAGDRRLRDQASAQNQALRLQARKKSTRLTFRVRRPHGGVGVFHAKGWWPKTSCPPSKVCLPWVSKRGIWDVPGFLPGCPGPLAVSKKFAQKKFVRIFRSLRTASLENPEESFSKRIFASYQNSGTTNQPKSGPDIPADIRTNMSVRPS